MSGDSARCTTDSAGPAVPVRGEVLCVRPPQHAVHRAIMVVDVERFGDPGRTNLNQLAVRDGLYKALIHAFGGSGIEWGNCVSEDRGDGALILVPPEVPKAFGAVLFAFGLRPRTAVSTPGTARAPSGTPKPTT